MKQVSYGTVILKDKNVKNASPSVKSVVDNSGVLDRFEVVVHNPMSFEQSMNRLWTIKKGCGRPHPLGYPLKPPEKTGGFEYEQVMNNRKKTFFVRRLASA
ncbi:hypothetical protein [Desulfoluna spongiiphila]|uniref:hypothetical protein n=1 Tax=Desulfoluna spongiiphila TaxID=419481 RepID=UPI001113357D|nr:hypothetical protein [Desulfoluna spongiiphila]